MGSSSSSALGWEQEALAALWARTALSQNAGALGLLEPLLTEEGPSVWSDGQVLCVTREALRTWLAQADPTQGSQCLAKTGLMVLEAWLKEPTGWSFPSSISFSPVVAIPDGDTDSLIALGEAVRIRLRTGREMPLRRTTGEELSWSHDPQGQRTLRNAWWMDAQHGWGHHSLSTDYSPSTPGAAWSQPPSLASPPAWAAGLSPFPLTVAEADAAWREGQRHLRSHLQRFDLEVELEIMETCLSQFPHEAEAWLRQTPAPRVPPESLFLLSNPHLIEAVEAAGADRRLFYQGNHLVPFHAAQNPGMAVALLKKGFDANMPIPELVGRVTSLLSEPQGLSSRVEAARFLVAQEPSRTLATDAYQDLMGRLLQKVISQENPNVLMWIEALWPAGSRLEDVRVPPGLPEAWRDTFAIQAVMTLESRRDPEDIARRLRILDQLGVNFQAANRHGQTLFFQAMPYCRTKDTPKAFYLLFEPYGVDWDAVDRFGNTAISTSKVKNKVDNGVFDLSFIRSHILEKHLSKTLLDIPEEPAAPRKRF